MLLRTKPKRANAEGAGPRHEFGSLVATARLEVIPIGEIAQRAATALPKRTRLSVTCLPKHGPVPAVETAIELSRAGFDVVPHLAARSVESRSQAADLLAQSADAGIGEFFVIGGDREEAAGPYSYASALIEDLKELSPSPLRIGVGGYPEAHPVHDDEGLTLALREKQRLGADYVVSQMCFDASLFAAWTTRIRQQGIDLPLVFGVPGVVERKRLIDMSARIGVGGALKFLRGKRRMMLSLLLSKRFRPGGLIEEVIAALPEGEQLRGVHMFSFNQLEKTAAWMARLDGQSS